MVNELYGLFENRDAAEKTEMTMLDAGFTQDEVRLELFDQGPEADAQEPLNQRRTVLVVTTDDPMDRQKAFGILAQSGARNLDPREARRHATALIPEPDYTDLSPATEEASSGVP